jgi:hypothetical protein
MNDVGDEHRVARGAGASLPHQVFHTSCAPRARRCVSKYNEAAHTVRSLAPRGHPATPCVAGTPWRERVARALSALTRVFNALWRGPGEGQRAMQTLF